jgi:hypothetical protein
MHGKSFFAWHVIFNYFMHIYHLNINVDYYMSELFQWFLDNQKKKWDQEHWCPDPSELFASMRHHQLIILNRRNKVQLPKKKNNKLGWYSCEMACIVNIVSIMLATHLNDVVKYMVEIHYKDRQTWKKRNIFFLLVRCNFYNNFIYIWGSIHVCWGKCICMLDCKF